MRRLALLTMVLLLGLPTFVAAAPRAPGDGSLEVHNARGVVTVNVRGGIIGRFDSGRLVVEDPVESDGSGPIVYGAERIRELNSIRTLYIGEDVRFRMIGGLYKVRVEAVGMDISAVGRGHAVLNGGGFIDAGRYAVNGGPMQPMPLTPTKVPLGPPPPQSGKELK